MVGQHRVLSHLGLWHYSKVDFHHVELNIGASRIPQTQITALRSLVSETDVSHREGLRNPGFGVTQAYSSHGLVGVA